MIREAVPDGGARRSQQARDVCLRQLTVRARSRAELDRKLVEKGFEQEVRAEVLDRLAEVGLINDRQFAENFVKSKHEGNGKTGVALAHAMRQRGLAETDVEAALEQITPEQQEAKARELVQKKLRGAVDPRDQRLVVRLVGMLARRGYGSGLALRVVRSELQVFAAE
ncbi:regulatory protein RecX [Segniliparus rotundus]|uniref:regulatory protein RecX n=1 Tax=Segniliparus rotundus TaxID=286802 RepID=UPI0002DC2955|nr:regulatory protein RecX [Segniliparus rotundus]